MTKTTKMTAAPKTRIEFRISRGISPSPTLPFSFFFPSIYRCCCSPFSFQFSGDAKHDGLRSMIPLPFAIPLSQHELGTCEVWGVEWGEGAALVAGVLGERGWLGLRVVPCVGSLVGMEASAKGGSTCRHLSIT